MSTVTEQHEERFELKPAVRETVPMLIALPGVSGSGKTYSALLLAAGLAGPKGRVGMIDAENKRGSLYADDPDIRAALPSGYLRLDLGPPYTPRRYVKAVTLCEEAGIAVCIIDSTSHEWEGEGGCCDIAETKKLRGLPNWSLAKMEHKRFVAHCLSSQMHIIFCLRAREKVKYVRGGEVVDPSEASGDGKLQVIQLGIQPITEKNFVFEMLLSLMIDEKTHTASPIKVPKMLLPRFPGAHMITKADGEFIRQWNESGRAGDPHEQLRKRARAAAETGTVAYHNFFAPLPPAQKKALIDTTHPENKAIAQQADIDAAQAEQESGGEKQPGDEPPSGDMRLAAPTQSGSLLPGNRAFPNLPSQHPGERGATLPKRAGEGRPESAPPSSSDNVWLDSRTVFTEAAQAAGWPNKQIDNAIRSATSPADLVAKAEKLKPNTK